MERKRYYPHEWALALLGFVMPLGATTQLAFLASGGVRIAAASLAAFFLCIAMLKLKDSQPLSKAVRFGLPAVIVYMAVISIATLRDDLPGIRYQLFALFPLAVLGFYITERFRPGGWLRIVYIISVGHLVLAVTTGSTRIAFGGAQRLEAGTSGVLLGFESVIVLVVAFWFIRQRRARFMNLCVMALAGYCLFAAFSRAAFLSMMLSACIVFVFWGRGKFLRFIVAAVAATLSYSVVLPKLISFLSVNDVESLYGASGRYRIWGNALEVFDEWFRGYGFTAMYDQEGPDAGLKAATFNLPLENTPLQALYMAGIIGVILWAWMYWRLVRVLWSVRVASGGVSLALLATLTVAAFYSVGLSGVSFDWWWLLGAFSFAGIVQSTESARRLSHEEFLPARTSRILPANGHRERTPVPAGLKLGGAADGREPKLVGVRAARRESADLKLRVRSNLRPRRAP